MIADLLPSPPSPSKSWITHCYIETRKDEQESLFQDKNGFLTVRLDSYAIIPVEKYCDLQKKCIELQDKCNKLLKKKS